ncbi:lamin tail domain-containing protein [Fodinibius sp. AD559]|uniref:lamin tail domain-containing protein n=1 Tax=Fodinibius sp. AD559 TaxID=3424179 RepID=UPI004046E4F3
MIYKSTLVFLFIGIFISITSSTFAQSVTIDEDFSDGDFTNNPTWTDGESKHTVNTLNMLQLDAPSESAEAVIHTVSTAAYGEWEAYIELGFNPSSSNLSRFYIVVDNQDMKGDIDGYFVQIGDTDDEVSLYRQDGNSTTKIINGTDGIVDTDPVTVRVQVTRDLNGNWELFADPTGSTSYTSQGTAKDNTYAQSEFIGLFSDYTSTRSNLFEYDDIKVTKVNPPLDIQNVTVVDNQTINISFNLDVDPTTVQTSDFSIKPNIGNPNITSTSDNVVQLTFNNPIPGGKYTLNVSNIADNEGNTIDPNTEYKFQFFDSYAQGDIIINEFVYDYPTTINEEYIEIRNTSSKYLNLANWQIVDNNSSSSLGSDPIAVEPDSFLVVSADTTELLNIFGNRAYHQASFPALNNTTPDAVQLITNTGAKADSLTYNSDWGGTNVALERRSASTPSIYHENWGNSPNPNGGTPGTTNEVTKDNTPPKLTNINIISIQTLQAVFDERLGQPGNYSITNNSISSVNQTAANTIELSLGSGLQNAQDYTLSIGDAEDIFGNTISPTDTSFTYYEPSPVDSGDVAINEFMFAPPANSSEYIELYNHSTKSLDLQEWTLSDNRESFEGTISNDQFIVPPDSFVVIAPDNTIESEYPNIALITMGDFPALNNGGDKIIIRDQNGTLLDSLTYTSDWGGEEIALERRTINISSSYQSNWGNAPNYFGTPGSSNDIEPDTEAPTVENFEIRSNTELAVIFSEQLDGNSAEEVNNYSILGSLSVENAQFSSPDTALLSLNNSLQNATTYTLGVENIADLFGNIMSATDTSFTYYKVSNADSGDVFVNEFTFVPPSGSTEYIEIYNLSNESFNLQGWTLSDNRGIYETITNSRFIIPPDSFIVIAPDNTLLTNHPDIALITMSSFPALNNGGDQIIIRNQNGILLDSLQYTPDWGGDEIALERRTTDISGIFRENWANAPNGFGTPGSQNEVLQDQTPPSFENLISIGNNKIELRFSEKIAPLSATDKQNYQLSPSVGIQLISAQNKAVTLFLEQELTDGQTYEVTASNISDIFDNTLSSATQDLKYLKIDNARSGQIVINEILYNPGVQGTADFIELYNTTDNNFDLTEWVVGDYSTETTIEDPLQLEAGEYLVLTGNQNFAAEIPNGVAISGFPSLNNNTPDDIYIRNKNGVTIDSLRYYQSWGSDTDGSSLERKDPLAASNDASNWQTNNSDNGISAGIQNVSFQKDTDSPKMIFSKVLGNGDYKIQFNEFIRLTDDAAFYAGEERLSITDFDSTNADVISLSFPTSKSNTTNANNTTIRAENFSDVKGNRTTSSEISVAQPLQKGDLVINEIMFNPLADSDDNQPDQTEYIELRNTRDYAISLEGLFLHDEPDEHGDIRDIRPVSTTAKWVPPQGHVLVHADESTNFKESQTATFFNLESPNKQSIMRADRSSLSLASSDDAIYVADSTGTTIDSVFYDESWHNPNIIDTRGIALERIAPGGPSNDDTNWGSSVTEKGGTPNSENSIYQENAQIRQETGISFNPNPFSPDDDGYEDNLFINYKLDHQDYLIKVRIYDRYGRLVRTLADGKQAGFEGQLIWDGRKDDNSRNRIGIYIVIFEAHDSASGSDLSFKKTVVLARKLN